MMWTIAAGVQGQMEVLENTLFVSLVTGQEIQGQLHTCAGSSATFHIVPSSK
jgi:hypothetical protein